MAEVEIRTDLSLRHRNDGTLGLRANVTPQHPHAVLERRSSDRQVVGELRIDGEKLTVALECGDINVSGELTITGMKPQELLFLLGFSIPRH